MSKAKQDNTNSLDYKHTAEAKAKMSESHKGKKHTAESKLKMSLVKKGKRLSDETKLNISLANMKYDPNYPYCEVWHDKEYINDIRKDYCENVDCKKRL